jgi:hypothetical protein
MTDIALAPFKRLILRAVLNDVSPIVARVIAVPDDLEISDLHEIFLSLLSWTYDPGFIIRIHAQEFNSFQRRSRGKRLRDFRLRRQEKFLYLCDTLDLWEWELRVLDVQEGVAGEQDPRCVEGRGAAPPENCGGSRGYRLMLKRQEAGPGVSDPAAISASMKVLAEVYRDEPEIDWQLFEEAVNSGWKNVEERLARAGPLTPTRFSLQETNERLALWAQRRRLWR